MYRQLCFWSVLRNCTFQFGQFSRSVVWFFVTPWTAARLASLSITNSQSLLKLMSIESVMPSSHLILCRSLLLLPSIFSSIRVFSNESVLHIRWSKYWSFSFSISPSNEYSGLISSRMDWLDLLAVHETLKSLLQHHCLHSVFSNRFITCLSNIKRSSLRELQAVGTTVGGRSQGLSVRMKVVLSPDGVVGPEFCLEQLTICLVSRSLQELLELNACVKSRFDLCMLSRFSHVPLFTTPLPQHARLPCPSPTARAYQNSCPLSWWCHPTIPSSVIPFPSPPALNLSQHQGLSKWVSSSHQVAKILEFQLQHQSFQWTPRTDLLWDGLVGPPGSPRDSQESSLTPQFKSINSLVLSFLYSTTLTSKHDYWKKHNLDYVDLCWQSNVSAF